MKLPSPLDKLDPAKIPAYELDVARRTAGANPPLQDLVAILGDSRLKHWAVVRCVAFSPDGKTLASGSHDNTVKLWDPTAGSELRTLKGHTSSVMCVAFSPAGKTLASGSGDQTVKLWDPATGSELRTLKGHTGVVISVAFSPDGKTLASGSADHTVNLWDPAAGSELRTLKGHTDQVYSVALSSDGKTLASASHDNTVKLWDPAVGSELRTLKGHSNHVYSVAFSPDGKTLASGSLDQTVRLWDVATGKEVQPLTGHAGQINSIVFSPDDRRLLTGGNDRTVREWDAITGKELSRYTDPYLVRSVVYWPRNGQALCGSHDTSLRVLDLATGRELRRFEGHTAGIASLAISPDGRQALTGSHDGSARLWDLERGKEVRSEQHAGQVCSVAFSPDGRRAISGCHEMDLKLWDVGTGKELRRFGNLAQLVLSVVISPDGLRVAYASTTTVSLWNLSSNVLNQPVLLQGHTADVLSVVFAQDARTLASAGKDGRVILWDANAVKIHEWQLPGPVHAVAFAADGRHLATANGNGTVYILRIPPPPKALTADEAKKKQADEAKRLGVPVQIENSIGMKLNLIPAGRFLMGSPENETGRQPNEGPQHEVTISKPFYIGVYEVTQEQYEKIAGNNPSKFNKENGGARSHPVEMVSWDDAVAYCKKLSDLPAEKKAGRFYRLPTEAEWEYACRAGSQTAYHFGDDFKLLDDYAWHQEKTTRPVGSLKPNAWGLFDSYGNVWEWCSDAYRDRYDGVGQGEDRVIRGGSYGVDAVGAHRSASRYQRGWPASNAFLNAGFRVVCEIRPAAKPSETTKEK